ncbi:hypothetical protein ACLK19_07725 [Escherichia coli]
MIVAFERAVADLPFAILATDQSTVNFAFHRQSRQLVWRDWVNKIIKSVLTPPAFLPVTFKKIGPVKSELVFQVKYPQAGICNRL